MPVEVPVTLNPVIADPPVEPFVHFTTAVLVSSKPSTELIVGASGTVIGV